MGHGAGVSKSTIKRIGANRKIRTARRSRTTNAIVPALLHIDRLDRQSVR